MAYIWMLITSLFLSVNQYDADDNLTHGYNNKIEVYPYSQNGGEVQLSNINLTTQISKMKEIKTILSVLCRHLNFLFNMNIKPELFRLAKYNNSDTNNVKTFWMLIRKILKLPPSENIVKSLKNYFLKVLNYQNLHFYSLPENMSSGTRELLLAFAFILAHGHLDNYVTKIVADSVFNSDRNSDSDNNTCSAYNFNLKHIKSERDFENILQWIEGKIRYNEREYQEYRDSFHKLLCKKNKFNANIQHKLIYLNDSEVLALSNEKDCKKFLEKTESVAKAIHLHTKWLHVQSDFWEWMNSVVLERQQSAKDFNSKELNNYSNTVEK